MSATSPGSGAQPEYQLKHRITGAIVLMVLAVVVIPMLLSEPALEANNDITGASADKKYDFKSRIVPLNINNVNKQSDSIDTAAVSDSTNSKVIEDTRPALLDLTQSDESGADETRAGEAPADKQESGTAQSSAVVLTVEDKPASEPSASDKPAIQEEPESPRQGDEPAEDVEVASAAPATNDAASNTNAVKDGWVVRVGTYSKDSNVVSVSSLLSNSGYKPNKTPVSTSLGPSTRVWLGPFAKRETADAISVKLKSLTGEKGYVTRSSS